jgi:hypothetical protein
MPKGLKIPVGVDNRGRAAIEKDQSKNTQKILSLAFQEGNDDNAFQLLGIDDSLIFSIKTASFRGKATQAVRRILAKFSELVRMDETTLSFDESKIGELVISFKYIDLLTNKEEEFTQGLKGKSEKR